MSEEKTSGDSKNDTKTINWPQVFATVGMAFAILGGYLTIRSIDKNFEASTAYQKSKTESLVSVQKTSAENYQKQIDTIRERILAVESKIEQIDPESVQKDSKTGVLLSGKNLELSKEITNGLEDLNKQVFRLPEGLAIPVNNARGELFNRFQSKVFDKNLGAGAVRKHEANPFYIRQFDNAVSVEVKEMIKKEP